MGEWLRAQNKESLKELWAIIREFVRWSLKKAKPGRVRHGGELEVFFDDTQIEVDGRCFKGTAINYEGALSYSWQTLWVGPFLADGEWGPGSRDPSESLSSTLEATASLWEENSGCEAPTRAFSPRVTLKLRPWRTETSSATPRNSLRPSRAAKIQRS